MPRYFFVLQWPDHRHNDPDGTVLPNDKSARGYAERIIRELKESGDYDDPALRMVVQKAGRGTVFSVPF